MSPHTEIPIHLTVQGDDVTQCVYERVTTTASQTYGAAVPVMELKTSNIPVLRVEAVTWTAAWGEGVVLMFPTSR